MSVPSLFSRLPLRWRQVSRLLARLSIIVASSFGWRSCCWNFFCFSHTSLWFNQSKNNKQDSQWLHQPHSTTSWVKNDRESKKLKKSSAWKIKSGRLLIANRFWNHLMFEGVVPAANQVCMTLVCGWRLKNTYRPPITYVLLQFFYGYKFIQLEYNDPIEGDLSLSPSRLNQREGNRIHFS